MIPDALFWTVTAGLAVGTFLIRFSFLGFLADRKMPDWLAVHLRYTAVAVFPALVTPLLLWPAATGGQTDPVRLIAAATVFAVGLRFNTVLAILAGMGTLYALQTMLGA